MKFKVKNKRKEGREHSSDLGHEVERIRSYEFKTSGLDFHIWHVRFNEISTRSTKILTRNTLDL